MMNNKKTYLKVITLIGLMQVFSVPVALANVDKNYLNLSEKLVVLRGQVSDLNAELQQLRDEYNLNMRGLITQKNASLSQIKQESIEIKRLNESLIENKKLIKNVGADKASIKAVLLIEAEKLKDYVSSGVPFKVNERLKSIDGFISNLQADLLSSHKATNSLWSMIEDELKLARTNSVYRQSVMVEGKEHLAHVAKVGMVMMYFRIGEDQYGMYKKTANTWKAGLVQGNDAAQIETLFDAFEKQIHIGYFELPNAL
jgi:uncharacterized protein DUF3450